jgi:hypothetical protein
MPVCDNCKKVFDAKPEEILKLRTKIAAWTRPAGKACTYPWNIAKIPKHVPYTVEGLKAAGIQVRTVCPSCARPKT